MTGTGTHGQRRRLLGLVLIAAMAIAACTTEQTSGADRRDTGEVPGTPVPAEPTNPATQPTDPVDPDTEPTRSTEPAPETTAPETTGPAPETTEPPPEALCTEEQLSSDEYEITFTTVHRVDAGELGALCFGSPNDTLLRAWYELAVITPPEILRDIVGFGGFDPTGFDPSGEETEILAFVAAVDEEGAGFQMSVNLAAADEHPEELQLTIAHEIAHVFTLAPDQLDRSVGDDCPTYFNGEGCYRPGSVMAEWIDAFWYDEILVQINPLEDAPAEEAEQRCDLDAGFFGTYAATNPEEDFAQAFAAYVYRLEPDSPQQWFRLEWIDARPDLAEFRARAIDAGRGPLRNLFPICGG